MAVMVIVCGRHGLWPSWLWLSWSWCVAVMVNFVAVMVCGRHGRTPYIMSFSVFRLSPHTSPATQNPLSVLAAMTGVRSFR